MRKQVSFILLIFSISTFSFTQQQDKSEPQSNVKHIVQVDFESQYGKGWQFSWNPNSTPHRIFGGHISQNFNANYPIASELSARDFITSNQIIFNIPDSDLELWVNEQHGNLRYLIFNQVHNSVPVWNGRIDFRYRLSGDLVLLGIDAYPNLELDTNPTLTMFQAISYGKVQVNFDVNLDDEVVGDPELFIWVENGREPEYHLSWLIELFVEILIIFLCLFLIFFLHPLNFEILNLASVISIVFLHFYP